jgi:hypothetical protein
MKSLLKIVAAAEGPLVCVWGGSQEASIGSEVMQRLRGEISLLARRRLQSLAQSGTIMSNAR